jgi:hypothetical protein
MAPQHYAVALLAGDDCCGVVTRDEVVDPGRVASLPTLFEFDLEESPQGASSSLCHW